MAVSPFEGLRPAGETDHARWAVEAMTGEEGVSLVVPEGFDACGRLLHHLEGGRRWSAVAPEYLRPGVEPYPYPFPEATLSAEGDMGRALVDALVPVLAAATTTPEQCHVGLWTGWGELHAGGGAQAPVHAFVAACPVQPWWGGRDLLLFDGPIEAVAAIGSPGPFDGRLRRRGSQWWWPADRAWFVGSEIDVPWTYVTGPAGVVDSILADPTVEGVPVAPADLW